MNKLKKEIVEWIKAFVIALVVVLAINVFYSPTMVYSISMNPTLMEKDILILKHDKDYSRGDIVSFESNLVLTESDKKKLNPVQKIMSTGEVNKNLIKRVIAVPGDSVRIEEERVFVNGELQSEPYIGSPTTGYVNVDEIPEGQYFLMGDNRSHSTDSRDASVGLVAEDRMIGKVIFRTFPFDKLGDVE